MPLNKIIDAIVEATNCSRETVTPESTLESLGIDSLKAINILYDLEEEFDIEVPNEVFAQLTTVGDVEVIVTRLIENKQN